LPPEKIAEIKRKGSVVIKDVVDDAEAIAWKDALEEFVKVNKGIEGQLNLIYLTMSGWNTS
jgi:hypothetical protein